VPPEEDQATATDNMHRNIVVSEICVDKQIDGWIEMLITVLCTLSGADAE